MIFERQRGHLCPNRSPAPCVLSHKRLPTRTPALSLPKSWHAGGFDRFQFHVGQQIAAADEAESSVVKIVIRPIVQRRALGRRSIPTIQVKWEQAHDSAS